MAVSSTGEKIQCLTDIDSDSYADVVNNYCFIMGTFTVDRLHEKQVGVQVPHPGVGPAEPDDELTFHSYYQWVPFVLFAQVISFVWFVFLFFFFVSCVESAS